MKRSLKILSAITLIILCATNSNAIASLHRMNVRRELVTVSGYSAGGAMAQTMFVSYSSKFHGVATISHAFYRCGPGIISNLTEQNDDLFDASCTKLFDPLISQLYDPNNAISDILNYFELGLIDDPKNMENKPLYIYAGSTSYVFPLQMGLGAAQVFEPFIKRELIKIVVQAANMTLPSDKRGLPDCSAPLNGIRISNCGYSAAYEALVWIIGKKYVRVPSKGIQLQPLMEFDQTEFFYGFGENVVNDDPVMDTVGFYYIPKICRRYGHKCLLHFYFHGCMTGRDVVGIDHILNSGYLEVAETNGIIVVFPQAKRLPLISDLGCWDTFAYTGDFYATQLGAQVTVIKNMLDRIVGLDYQLDKSVDSETYADTDTKETPKKLVVPPELMRAYGDTSDHKVLYESESMKNRYCTVTRVSSDTVLKRCRPVE